MPLVKDGRVVEDAWVMLADDVPLADGARPIVSLDRWQAERPVLAGRNGPLGLRLRSDQPPAAIVADLGRFALIALEFPKFTDGRAYSHARLLRERHGFAGELRAVGNVLRDQFLFMLRCGFDAFEVADEAAAAAWAAAISEIGVCYQPAADGRIPAAVQRRWRGAAAMITEPAVIDRAEPAAAARSATREPVAAGWAY